MPHLSTTQLERFVTVDYVDRIRPRRPARRRHRRRRPLRRARRNHSCAEVAFTSTTPTRVAAWRPSCSNTSPRWPPTGASPVSSPRPCPRTTDAGRVPGRRLRRRAATSRAARTGHVPHRTDAGVGRGRARTGAPGRRPRRSAGCSRHVGRGGRRRSRRPRHRPRGVPQPPALRLRRGRLPGQPDGGVVASVHAYPDLDARPRAGRPGPRSSCRRRRSRRWSTPAVPRASPA